MIKLSKPSKMPCLSWSLQAIDTCPASKRADGALVDACAGCYATDGNYRFKNVKAVRDHNKTDWQRDDWCADMIGALEKQSFFRWFDSGDLYSLALAEKIYTVMRATPNCAHWLPTRMHKFAKFKPVLARMARLKNVVVRLSSDSINGETIRGKNTSVIVSSDDQLNARMQLCEAYTRGGKCGDCRECWNKSVPVIAYPAHGRKMLSIIARSAA